MKTSELGLDLIRGHEGLRLKAYQCPAGVWTIGYGHTKGVKPGDVCTPDQANAWLQEDLEHAERAVHRLVTVYVSQDQFDALVSFVFNLGARRFEGSTLLRRLNSGDFHGAAKEFLKWVHAGKERLPGLVVRRGEENALFRRGTA